MKLKDRVAIITGGGRGIGQALAVAFAREGASVAVASRTPFELQDTLARVRAIGGECLPVPADVADREQVELLVTQTVEAYGKVDILVNNAGIQGPIGLLLENDPQQWIRTIQVNLVGTYLCMKATLPLMMERRQGKIINFSGGGATGARPRFSAYAASKAAVVRLTETIAEEVRAFNVQVNAIAPGAVNTRMLEEILAAGETAGESELAQAQQKLKEGSSSAESATELAIFLASSDSDQLTGKLLSAVYDPWRAWDADKIAAIDSSALYTLRRLDPHTVSPLSQVLESIVRK